MNPDRLLVHYERVADAPEAVSRLRRFILDLAVRGKLVPQDPNDEPAAALLKRITTEKARLEKAGEIRKSKAVPALTDEDVSFQLPANWTLSRIAGIGVLSPRNSVADETLASFVPMARISADYGARHGDEVRRWGEIKKGYTHFAEGDVGLAKITPCFENGKSAVFENLTGGVGSGTTELHIVRPIFVDPRYLLIFLKCPYFIETGIPKMTGTAGQKRLPADHFAHLPFPLPPVAEQRRIVAKVDELMTLCDRLAAAQAEREAARGRFATASLARLSAPDIEPVVFRRHAVFTLDHLAELADRPDQIKALRRTILDLAMLGRLVPQEENDEPASELLRRVAKEKERLTAKGRVNQAGTVLRVSELPFDLPQGWAAASLQSVCLSVCDGDHQPPPKSDMGVPFLVIGNVSTQRIDFSGCRFVPREYYDGLDPIRQPKDGDLLYTLVGSFGIPVFVSVGREFCVQRHIGILRPSKSIDSDYLYYAMGSSLVFDQASKCATGVAQKTVPLGGLRKITIPIPPLAEQRRIAAKISELTELCDQLAKSLSTISATRLRLLDAALDEAMIPVCAKG